jgi:hypothetical protein
MSGAWGRPPRQLIQDHILSIRHSSQRNNGGDCGERTRNNRPISVYHLGEMPIQSCGQRVSAPRVKAGARLTAHTELRAEGQRSAREAIYRHPPIAQPYHECDEGPDGHGPRRGAARGVPHHGMLRLHSRRAAPVRHRQAVPIGRGLHSFTLELNMSSSKRHS